MMKAHKVDMEEMFPHWNGDAPTTSAVLRRKRDEANIKSQWAIQQFEEARRKGEPTEELIRAGKEAQQKARDADREYRLYTVRRKLAVDISGWMGSAPFDELELAVRVPAFLALTKNYDARCSALLAGPTGIGKSTAAALMSRRRIEQVHADKEIGYAFTWVTALDLTAAIQRHPLGKGRPDVLESATEARLLVLDDLGQEKDTQNVLMELLNARYAAQQPTITTTGLTPDELQARYGVALYRRLTELNGKTGKVIAAFKGAK